MALDPALKPLTSEQALAVNSAATLTASVGSPARPFVLPLSRPDYPVALRCLTQAIYYEAANEPNEGQAAVAQVVLNRMRHPAFPHNVCGVVYEGSERPTGCQFSFTCDGSLVRSPSIAGWRRARLAAAAALAGKVEARVGYATHYHANYVVPYWADSLDRTAIIGAHLFYRWKGYWGTRPAFSASYQGSEAVPVPPLPPVEPEGLTDIFANSIAVPTEAAPTIIAKSKERTEVEADRQLGALRGELANPERPKPSQGALPPGPKLPQ